MGVMVHIKANHNKNAHIISNKSQLITIRDPNNAKTPLTTTLIPISKTELPKSKRTLNPGRKNSKKCSKSTSKSQSQQL